MNESGGPGELLFSSWPPSSYSSYYDLAGQEELPEIRTVSKADTPHIEQRRLSKLVEIAEEGDALQQYPGPPFHGVINIYENNRYDEVVRAREAELDSGSLIGGRNRPTSKDDLLPQRTRATSVNMATSTTEVSMTPRFYDSATMTAMNSYEQAALSSLIRLAKQVQSASGEVILLPGAVDTHPSDNPDDLLPTCTNYTPIDSRLLQQHQQQSSSSSTPLPLDDDPRGMRETSSPEEEEEEEEEEDMRKHLHPSHRPHAAATVAVVVAVSKKPEPSLEPMDASFAVNNCRYAVSAYPSTSMLYTEPVKVFGSSAANHTNVPLETGVLLQSEVPYTSQMSFEVFTEHIREAGVHLNDCRQRVTDVFFHESDVTAPAIWAHMMAQFETHAHQVIRFARSIPGFRDLPRSDTKFLVQASMYPIILVQLSREPSVSAGDFNFYNFPPRERRHLLAEFPQLNPLADHFYELNAFLGPMSLDDTEAALLCSIIFLRGSNQKLLEEEKVYEIYNHAASALQHYITVHYSSDERFTQLIKLLPGLSSMNETHRLAVQQLHHSRPDLHYPDLFVQMFQLDVSNQSGGARPTAGGVDNGRLVGTDE